MVGVIRGGMLCFVALSVVRCSFFITPIDINLFTHRQIALETTITCKLALMSPCVSRSCFFRTHENLSSDNLRVKKTNVLYKYQSYILIK